MEVSMAEVSDHTRDAAPQASGRVFHWPLPTTQRASFL